MDSISMALKMIVDRYEVTLFHGDLQQKSEAREHEAVMLIGEILDVHTYFVDMGWLGQLGGSSLTDEKYRVPLGMDSLEESTFIKDRHEPGLWTPGRNVVLLAQAAAYAESVKAKYITWGANQSETAYPDNTLAFAKVFSEMLQWGCLDPPEVIAPLYHLDKVGLLEWGYDNGYGNIYAYTWSCDLGKPLPCGTCGCCCNRQFAFHIANKRNPEIIDEREYINPGYFEGVYLDDVLDRCTKEMWMFKYLEEL
jgi:7-cyano-7-deazaguanine synthase